MKTVTTKAIAKVAAVATGLAMATSMLSLAPIAHAAALTSSQVAAIVSLLQSSGADPSTIANVQASLTGGSMTTTTSGSTTTTSSGGSCSFSRDLTIGSTGTDVTALQNWLISNGYSIPAGATGYFGVQTRAAVSAWQKAKGISPTAGYFGPKSRAAIGCSSTTTTTTTTTSGGSMSAGTGTGLKIMLSPTSPNGTVLVQGQGVGDLGDFVFANPTASPINVTALSFMRTGVSNDSTLLNVYLYNGVNRITDSAGVSSSAFSFSNPSGIFTVPAGMTYTVSVRSDIATNSSGQQIGVELVSATSSGTLDPSVSFPISSGYQTVSAANLATVDFSQAPTPSTAISISPQNAYPVWQDTVNVSTNPVKLTSMKFTNIGSTGSSNIINLQLYVDGTAVGSVVPALASDRTVTFDLSAAPLLLSTQSHVVKVLANITAGGAGDTIEFTVQRSSDALFVDSQLNQPVTPTYKTANFSSVATAQITLNSVTSGGGVSVSRDPASPSQSVAVGASNVQWATFDMLASGENVKVTDLYVYAADSIHTTGGLSNGKVYLNGVQIGSTKSIGYTDGTDTDFALGSSLILPAGQTSVVGIYASAQTSTSTNLSNGETVTVYLVANTSNAQGMSSLGATGVPNGTAGTNDVAGNTLSISSSSLTANKYSGYGAQTVIAGSNNAKLGAFTLTTGSTEGVTVNTIAIKLSQANAASITNLTLKDDATGNTLGSVITTPASGDNSFSVSSDIAVSSTKTVDIYGNILSSANAGPIQATVDTGTTGTGDVTGISASVASPGVALQTITVGSGTLTVTRGAGDPTSNNVLAGASSVMVGEFNFAAQNSPFTVQNLAILVPNGAATSVTSVTVSYKDVNGVTQTSSQPLAVTAANAYATAIFTGLTMNVPANDSANLDVYVGTPTIASGATSGAAINVSLDEGTTTTAVDNSFKAVNSAGSSLTYAQGSVGVTTSSIASGGTFYVRKSIPTFAVPTGQGGGLVPTNPIYRFSISADPAGAIEWTKLTFTVATSSTAATNMLTSAYLVDESTGNNILDNNSTSASTTGTKVTVDLTKNETQPQYQQIAAGQTKTYDLDGTIAGFTTGSSLSISLAQDTATAANAAPGSVSGSPNVVWSDRSAVPHTAPSVGVTASSDFTNGYLLKNFTTNSVSYSK